MLEYKQLMETREMTKVLILILSLQVALGVAKETVASRTPYCNPCACYRDSAGTIRADCSSRQLRDVPRNLSKDISVLDISNNLIHVFNKSLDKYRQLSVLNASSNNLHHLDIKDFVTLSQLEHLDLSSNNLHLRKSVFPEGLFQHQTKLSTLLLQNNSDIVAGIGYRYPDETFSDLISLQTLRIDGLLNCFFGEGFKKLQKLHTLSLEGYCGIETLQNDSFKNLQNISCLNIAECQIKYIEPSAFAPLSNTIDSLDLSYNYDLGIINFGHALYGLQNKSVKLLKAHVLHRHRGTGILIRYEDFYYMQNVKIEELHVDENRIELIQMEVPSLLSSVKKISAKRNMFLFGPFIFTGQLLKKLEWTDVSGQGVSNAELIYLNDDIEETILPSHKNMTPCECLCSSKTNYHWSRKFLRKWDKNITRWPVFPHIQIPPNIRFANFSGSKYSFKIDSFSFGKNNLRTLDLSHNFFRQWKGPIKGLEKLESIDLSNNLCDFIDDNFTNGFPALKEVKLSRNYLGFVLKKLNVTLCSKLEYLDLSDNKITKLPKYFFKSMHSLKQLDLSFNYLNSWDASVRNVHNLTKLNLASNMFESLPLNLESQLESISHGRLKVNLEKNPLKCNCMTLPSLKWLDNFGRNLLDLRFLTCTKDNINLNMTNLHDIVLELEKTCASYVRVMVGILCVVMLFLALAISGLVYRYRWKLRYFYYLTMNRHRGYLNVPNEEHNFEFDAFISYADEDRGIVVRDMRRILEEPEEQAERFRLCIHHRDFLAGEAIAANILKAINTSRKTVVILTRNFLKSYWCRYEVEMAKMESIYRGRNTLLIVVMEDIPVKDIPVDIMETMRNDSYVEFTNDREGQEVFWQNLKRAIQNY